MKNIIIIIFAFTFIFNPLLRGQNSDWEHQQDSIRKLWQDTSLYFPQTTFSKVIGYTFNAGIFQEGKGAEISIYNRKTKKLAKSINPKVYYLTKPQIDTLLSIINDTTTFDWGESGCYIPHYAFIFYNFKNKPVASFEIGFSCHQTSANPVTPIMKYGGLIGSGWKRLRNFCEGIGMQTNDYNK